MQRWDDLRYVGGSQDCQNDLLTTGTYLTEIPVPRHLRRTFQSIVSDKCQPSFAICMASDDSSQLYDPRVEVICPADGAIFGAKAGDYFTLEGEML